jgi:hypothetical protein
MNLMKLWRIALMMTLWVASVISLGGTVDSTHAALITQLELSGGAANWTGPQARMLDRLFGQDGVILMGQYQGFGQIGDTITQGQKTYSLFTSGLNGAPTPSGSINGNTITVDLSSLFFGWQRGDQIHAWNIGGSATGLYNPETSEFSLSWDHVLNNARHHQQGKQAHLTGSEATFFLKGTAILESAAPVAIPAALYLFGTGVFGLGSWSWWKRRGLQPTAS